MYRLHPSYPLLILLIAAISIFSAGLSHADTQQPSLIEIIEKQSAFNLGRQAIIIPDEGINYTVQNIISLISKGSLPEKNNSDIVKLSNKNIAHWVIIPLKNNTDQRQWVLDFGTLYNDQSGVVEKLLIYETTQKEILYNRLQNNHINAVSSGKNSKINVQLPANDDATLIIYILPDESKPFQFNPVLTEHHFSQHSNHIIFSKILDDHIVTVLILSIITTLIGFILTRGVGYIAILLYYIIIGIWFYGFERLFISDNFILYALSPFVNLIVSLIILLATFFTVPARHSSNYVRLPLIFVAVANVTTLIIISMFPERFFSPLSYHDAALVMAMITQIMCIIFLVKVQSQFLKVFAYYLACWIGLLTLSQIIVVLGTYDYLTANYFTLYADRLILYPQYILLVIGMILSVNLGHTHILNKVKRETERNRTLMNAQKGKETIDNSRLLRVIEREREVMEELRARESERTEEMRDAKVAADEANQAKSAFLAVVSHEIRTPMTGMIGMLRIFEKTNLTEEQREYLEVVKDSSDTMLALLNDILDFSKIEQGGLTFETIEFDLRRVVATVKTLMQTYASQKNVALNVVMDDNLSRVYYGDPTRLRQILLNLVGNALKFTDNGHVSISAIIESGDDNIANIRFVVEDTGIGISEDAQKELFKPFSQADSSISRKYGGTGLGLAICKTLVNAMHGEIKVESQENVGTKFEFTIPFLKHDNATQQVVREEQPKHKANKQSSSIMIIDDNDINLRIIDEYLNGFGHQTMTYTSAKKALNDLQKNDHPDFIFVDIEMPEMNGLDFASVVFDNNDLKYIPLIAMTGNVGDDDLKKYQRAGLKGFIAKPFEPDLINTLIQTMSNDKDYSNFDFDSEPESEDTPSTNEPKRAKKKIATGKALNEEVLINLKNGLGSHKLNELLEDLFTTTDNIIAALHQALAEGDNDAIKAKAHELRGMSANYGLSAMSEKATEIEKLAGNPDYKTEDFLPHITDLETLIERSKIATDTFLK